MSRIVYNPNSMRDSDNTITSIRINLENSDNYSSIINIRKDEYDLIKDSVYFTNIMYELEETRNRYNDIILNNKDFDNFRKYRLSYDRSNKTYNFSNTMIDLSFILFLNHISNSRALNQLFNFINKNGYRYKKLFVELIPYINLFITYVDYINLPQQICWWDTMNDNIVESFNNKLILYSWLRQNLLVINHSEINDINKLSNINLPVDPNIDYDIVIPIDKNRNFNWKNNVYYMGHYGNNTYGFFIDKDVSKSDFRYPVTSTVFDRDIFNYIPQFKYNNNYPDIIFDYINYWKEKLNLSPYFNKIEVINSDTEDIPEYIFFGNNEHEVSLILKNGETTTVKVKDQNNDIKFII